MSKGAPFAKNPQEEGQKQAVNSTRAMVSGFGSIWKTNNTTPLKLDPTVAQLLNADQKTNKSVITHMIRNIQKAHNARSKITHTRDLESHPIEFFVEYIAYSATAKTNTPKDQLELNNLDQTSHYTQLQKAFESLYADVSKSELENAADRLGLSENPQVRLFLEYYCQNDNPPTPT